MSRHAAFILLLIFVVELYVEQLLGVWLQLVVGLFFALAREDAYVSDEDSAVVT